ncbi:MAG: hypothetical protein HYV39_01955 [Candidatus Levybacteria bacterium]|nr:hypothetical protein [Candidatus Levybacteria bacterium]
MPDPTNIVQQLVQPLFLLKVLFLIVLFLYIIFTFVVFNQVRVMNRVVTETHSSAILALIALLNFLAAISLFIYALAIL